MSAPTATGTTRRHRVTMVPLRPETELQSALAGQFPPPPEPNVPDPDRIVLLTYSALMITEDPTARHDAAWLTVFALKSRHLDALQMSAAVYDLGDALRLLEVLDTDPETALCEGEAAGFSPADPTTAARIEQMREMAFNDRDTALRVLMFGPPPPPPPRTKEEAAGAAERLRVARARAQAVCTVLTTAGAA